MTELGITADTKLNAIDDVIGRVAIRLCAILCPIVSGLFTYEFLMQVGRLSHHTSIMVTTAVSMAWGAAIMFVFMRFHRTSSGVHINMDRTYTSYPDTFTPHDESGTIIIFAQHAEELGFSIISIGRAFPDATLRVDGKIVQAEFEYQSRNFKSHRHDPNGCDLIICWEHNWDDCPLPVIALKDMVE